jgi:hypothetical protein
VFFCSCIQAATLRRLSLSKNKKRKYMKQSNSPDEDSEKISDEEIDAEFDAFNDEVIDVSKLSPGEHAALLRRRLDRLQEERAGISDWLQKLDPSDQRYNGLHKAMEEAVRKQHQVEEELSRL